MRHLATIQKILSVSPIEGADRIELVKVLGWQVVCPKGQFQPGDLCVYFEIDSFLPIREEFEFLRKSSYKKNELLGEGFRLKTITMRGQISQGLLMPVSIIEKEGWHGLPEGTDVTQILGVKEWEVQEQATNAGTIIGQLPSVIHKTDETRIQSMPELFEAFRGVPYYITTKLDGTSCSVCIDDNGTFHVTGHNFEYKDDGRSGFYEYVKRIGLETRMRNLMHDMSYRSMTIQGEWCGGGIQKNRLKLQKPEWFVFTVDIDGKRTDMQTIFNTADLLGLKTVPLEESGRDLHKNYPTIEALLARSGMDPARIYAGGQPEGIVIRPVKPVYSEALKGPLSIKVINNHYLTKNE